MGKAIGLKEKKMVDTVDTLTLGQKFAKKHFRPHLELPEEMPVQIRLAIADTGIDCNVDLDWMLMRTGLGDVLAPSLHWQNHYEFAQKMLGEGYRDKEETRWWVRETYINGHLLIGLMFQIGFPGGMPSLYSAKAEEIVDFMIHYIDSFPEIEAEYAAIAQKAKAKKGISDGLWKRAIELEARIHVFMREEIADKELARAIELAKAKEEIDGIPWYAAISVSEMFDSNDFNPKRLGLNAVEQAIFDDAKAFLLKVMSMGGTPWYWPANVADQLEMRRSKIHYYTQDVE